MTLRLYDTATRATRDFVPLEAGRVGIYLCGLTVQSEPHVGHVRSGVNFDVLRRWLRARGYDVAFIRNITDIDDKILLKAAEQDRPWYNLAYAMRRQLDAAYDSLNVEPPTYEPAATGHVPEMIELITTLIGRGHAYAAEDGSGDVYFDVRSWPAYGELTGQRIEDMEAAEDAEPQLMARKRDPRDFALWKGWKKESEPQTAAWPSPWGPGRPGWHIECSAMALKYLGTAFDIHGGGVDLRFPHHENEQAQSRAAGHPFASYWMHNAWITTAGEKMSKSLGNSLVIPEVLKRVRAIDLRFYMVAAHYRSHVEFSYAALEEAAAGFARIEHFLARATSLIGEPVEPVEPVEPADRPVGLADRPVGLADRPVALSDRPVELVETLPSAFVDAMDDDLGTPAAVAAIYDLVREGNKLLAGGDSPELRDAASSVRAMLAVLGLDPFDEHWSGAGSSTTEARLTAAVDALVGALIEQRATARAAKDFATADAIRDRIKAAGIELEDTPQGPQWSL